MMDLNDLKNNVNWPTSVIRTNKNNNSKNNNNNNNNKNNKNVLHHK